MFQLPESVEDFNHKYHDTIAVVDYSILIQKKKQRAVCRIDGVRGDSLNVSTLSQNKNGQLGWNTVRNITLEGITNFTTPTPKLGYIAPTGCWPIYLHKVAVKNYKRAYNSQAIAVSYASFLAKAKPFCPFKLITKALDPELVRDLFDEEFVRYKKIRGIRKETDYFAVLSKDFAAFNDGDKWLLMYQNYLIGSLFPLSIDAAVRGLEDVYHSQVIEGVV